MSNSLDPDQARRFVGPDLGPNCLPKLSADGTGRQKVKGFVIMSMYYVYAVFLPTFQYYKVQCLRNFCQEFSYLFFELTHVLL